ncbi:MAG: CPBP family intramembrane metalloprotease [Planctomycetes bacterium]|nr:CPBP family intramembrane metalloprotease [Planctomycetota bacterium]
MSDVVTPHLQDAWPQALVLAAAFLGFLWSAAFVRRRMARGEPLVAARPHAQVPWEAGDVAVVVVGYLVAATLMTRGMPESRPVIDRLVGNAVLSLGTMLAGIAWLRFRGADWPALGFPGGRLRDDLAVACRALGLVVFPLLMAAAALNAIVTYDHPIVNFLDGRRDLVAAALVVISAVVVAPLTEEFFFRRILQGWLEKHFADESGVAVALSAIAFASAHAGQGLAFLPLFPLALVLGLIAERTGSIVPCVLLHAMFNAVSVFLLLAQPGRGAAG